MTMLLCNAEPAAEPGRRRVIVLGYKHHIQLQYCILTHKGTVILHLLVSFSGFLTGES